MLVDDIVSLVGNTPMVRLKRLSPKDINIYVKLEFMNPTGSHKDRIALYMIKDAIARGELSPGGYLIEASSGNTAISVAWLSSMMGFKPILVVNENVSQNKVNTIKALGGEVITAPYVPEHHPQSKYNIALRISRERRIPYLNQMANEANVRAHYETTAREIFEDLRDTIDYFVMGIGTCGTLAGVGRFLKERLGSKVKVVGVVPRGSRVLHPEEGVEREYIEGLTSEKVPEIYERYRDLIDYVIEVSYEESLRTLAMLVREEGILGGPSTGANVCAALRIAEEVQKGVNIVTLAPDSLFKYPKVVDELPKYLR